LNNIKCDDDYKCVGDGDGDYRDNGTRGERGGEHGRFG